MADVAEMADVGIDEDELDEVLDWFDDDEVDAEGEDDEVDEVDEVDVELEEEVDEGEDDALIEDESGWFADPDVEGQERFWDGTEWTDHVRPMEDMEEEPESRVLHGVDAEKDDEVDEDDDFEVDEVEIDEDDEDDEVEVDEDDGLIEDQSGWFADPDVEGQERFWDGTEWTDHVRPIEEEPESRVLQGVDAEKDDEVDEVELEDDEVEEDEVEWAEDDGLIEDESGWFSDPDVEGQERFWDGTEWTDHVRPIEDEPQSRVLHGVDAERDDEVDEDDVSEVEVDEVELEQDDVEEDDVEWAEDDALVEDDEVDEVELEEDDGLSEDESGWFADPDVEGQERFWDGTAWTHHVRPIEEEPESGALHEVDAEKDDEVMGAEDDTPVDDEVDSEGDGVEEVEVEALLSKRSEDDALIDDDESGWLPDPDVEGQERFWDGTEWTDQVRPVEEEPDFAARVGIPDHVPELQRALAAATADIDDVEARLSTLFDRGAGKSRRGRGASEPASPGTGAAAAELSIHEEFGGNPSTQAGGDPIHTNGAGIGVFSGDDEAFAELDAALAAEEPEKAERRFFKRRS